MVCKSQTVTLEEQSQTKTLIIFRYLIRLGNKEHDYLGCRPAVILDIPFVFPPFDEVDIKLRQYDGDSVFQRNRYSHTRLKSVTESLNTLNDLLATLGLLIGEVKVWGEQKNNDDNDKLAGNAGIKTWVILWSILGAEDEGTDNATDTAHADESSAAESALPVTTNVVCLRTY
jgi:hypothetical protein